MLSSFSPGRSSKIVKYIIYTLCFIFLFILLFTFVRSLWADQFVIKTKKIADWDIMLKAVAGIVAIPGAILAISRYLDEKEKENYNSFLTAQAPFFAKRQEVYYSLVATTAQIGNTSRDDPARKLAEADFWKLYWGVVPLVADNQVSQAVDEFSIVMYPEKPISDEAHDILLRNASMNLARACRQSLGFDGPNAVSTTKTVA